MGMRTEKKAGILDRYKEWTPFLLFVLFTIFCALQAMTRGALEQFISVEFWVIFMAVLLLILLPQGFKSRLNKRLALVMLVLMTIGSLIQSVLEVVNFQNGSYKGLSTDYFLSAIIAVAVLLLYPKIGRLLSSNFVLAALAAINLAIYPVLLVFGEEVGGVRAWLMNFQLTELVKPIFVFVLAGLLSKRKSVWAALLAVLYMAVNAVGMAVISEYGTLMILCFVFLFFLFVFPNRLWWMAGVLSLGAIGLVILGVLGSGIYTTAMEESPSKVFAEKFVGKVRAVEDENGTTVSGMKMLQQMIEECQQEEVLQNNEELKKNFSTVLKRLYVAEEAGEDEDDTGKLTQEDFTEGNASAVNALEKLCKYKPFRQMYLDNFCRDDFYGDTAQQLYRSTDDGLLQPVKQVILNLYSKMVSRFIMTTDFFNIRSEVLQINNTATPYQNRQAEKAMQIGGLTGADIHSFVYVPVLESDMVYSELVSLFGFAMGLFIILMNMILFREGVRIQQGAQDAPFHQGVALGMSMILFIQALVIIAGNLGVFPLTGITLPFISNGSASMLVCVLMVMLLLAISSMDINEDTTYMDNVLKWNMGYMGIKAKAAAHGTAHQLGAMGKVVKEKTGEGISKISEISEESSSEDIEEDPENKDYWESAEQTGNKKDWMQAVHSARDFLRDNGADAESDDIWEDEADAENANVIWEDEADAESDNIWDKEADAESDNIWEDEADAESDNIWEDEADAESDNIWDKEANAESDTLRDDEIDAEGGDFPDEAENEGSPEIWEDESEYDRKDMGEDPWDDDSLYDDEDIKDAHWEEMEESQEEWRPRRGNSVKDAKTIINDWADLDEEDDHE